jgi:hypothetical protein
MKSPEHFTAHLLRRLPWLGIFACVSLCVIARSARAQDLYDFNPAASEMAGAIDQAAAGSVHTTVLVTDFTEMHDPDSQLAVVLAQNFAQSLRSHARNFTVLDHRDVEAAISNHKLPIGALSSRSVVACYAPELGVTLIIAGWIAYTPENMILDIGVESLAGDHGISGKKIITPLTAAMETLRSQPAVGTEAIFGEDRTVWVRDESSKTTVTSARSGAGGYSYPACIHCPQVPFTDAAVKAKTAGTVTLSVVIGADGKRKEYRCSGRFPADWINELSTQSKTGAFDLQRGPTASQRR